MRQIVMGIATALIGQRGHLFPWVPVCLGLGIGLYFLWRSEPVWPWLPACAVAGALLLLLQRRAPLTVAPLVAALGLVALGFALAGARAHWVAGPQLGFRYYGPVEGRVVEIDRSASDALRLTLDQVVLRRMDPAQTPRRVRVSLHGEQGALDPGPGQRIILTGHLGPPGGAVEPGGFDFRRHAWFLQLGAVGYTRNPVLLLEPPAGGQWVFRARMALSARVQAALPGETGAFAAAVMTGDRSGIGEDTLDTLRRTNLAHLLAISGLHMGLLAGFVFTSARLALLLVPRSRHYWPVKKIAAGVALAAAAGYLALSGGNVATQRAFVMVAVMLTAVMLDRRALSLRAVALAAVIVLVLRPEALLSPGFQMSFAATVALVTVFGLLRDRVSGRRGPAWLRPVLPVVISSVTASLATAPVAMAHFNLLSHYGLVANLLSVPVMGALVMPLAVISALLMPLGLDWAGFLLMGLGLDWILGVARMVSGWEGSVGRIVAPGPWVLPLIAAGGLVLCLWQGKGRLAGLLPLLLAALLWSGAQRPDMLIADTGTLVGVMTPQGRALSRPQGAGFQAEVWLENDGQEGGQERAAGFWPEGQPMRLAALSIRHLQGKRAVVGFSGCGADEIVVSSVDLPGKHGCEVFDPARLRQTGAVALWMTAEGPRVVTASERAKRLWHGAR